MGESMGKLFGGLTKTEVQNDGKSALYNSPAAAGMAIADAVRRTASPATSNVQGELTPPAQGVAMLPGPVNASVPDVTPSGDNASVSMSPPVTPAPPMMKKTSFREAASTSPDKLTTKGTVLRLLLESGLGAAAGAGSRTVGEGSARALQAQKARSELVTEANQQEQQRANLADLPGDKARAQAHLQSQTDLANAQKDSLKSLIPVEVTDQNGNKSTMMVPQKSAATIATAKIGAASREKVAAAKPQAPIDVGKAYAAAVAKAGPDAATDPEVQRLGQSLDFINKNFPKGSLDSQLAQAYRNGDPKEIAILENVVKKTRTDPRMAMVMARPVKVTNPEDGSEYYDYASSAIGNKELATTGANLQKNAFTPAARFNDIERAYSSVDRSIGAYDGNDSQRGLIISALRDGNKENPGVLATFTKSKLFKEMNPPSRDLVTGVLSLREQIMGINQVLTGSSTSSDVRTAAIWNTLPDGSEPDSDMARRKMKLVRGMIDNLRQGFPMIDKYGKGQPKQDGTGALQIIRDKSGRITGVK